MNSEILEPVYSLRCRLTARLLGVLMPDYFDFRGKLMADRICSCRGQGQSHVDEKEDEDFEERERLRAAANSATTVAVQQSQENMKKVNLCCEMSLLIRPFLQRTFFPTSQDLANWYFTQHFNAPAYIIVCLIECTFHWHPWVLIVLVLQDF